MSDLAEWVALSLIPGVGGRTLDRLLDRFGSPGAILAASQDDLQAVPRIGPQIAAAIGALDLDRTRAAIAAWQANGITILRRDDPAYPPALAPLDDAPPVLFRRGQTDPGDDRAVAIVGTRQPAQHSRQLAGALAESFCRARWCIVSGLAAGIDAAAHAGALNAGGRTVAVLGNGVRVAYPPHHAALMERIAAQGTLVSEAHPDAAPNSPALVARNRLISGMSQAVIVIEAGPSSGSLHAARFARAQGRPVYAVDDGAAGNRALIAQGARALPPDPGAWAQVIADLGESE